jgi:hypothetical protein
MLNQNSLWGSSTAKLVLVVLTFTFIPFYLGTAYSSWTGYSYFCYDIPDEASTPSSYRYHKDVLNARILADMKDLEVLTEKQKSGFKDDVYTDIGFSRLSYINDEIKMPEYSLTSNSVTPEDYIYLSEMLNKDKDLVELISRHSSNLSSISDISSILQSSKYYTVADEKVIKQLLDAYFSYNGGSSYPDLMTYSSNAPYGTFEIPLKYNEEMEKRKEDVLKAQKIFRGTLE